MRALLTDYRDNNSDHLPAHRRLLEFLLTEYLEDTQLILPELKVLCTKFPFQTKEVVQYCEMLLKESEDSDLEDSFESTEEAPPAPLGSRDKTEMHREVLTRLADCLDFPAIPNNPTKQENIQIWTFLVESLKFLASNHQENQDFVRNIFENKDCWWFEQNLTIEPSLSDQLLVKKSIVSLLLLGADSEYFQTIEKNLRERRLTSSPSNRWNNLLKEQEFVSSSLRSPFLAPTGRQTDDLPGEGFVQAEWEKINNSNKEKTNFD